MKEQQITIENTKEKLTATVFTTVKSLDQYSSTEHQPKKVKKAKAKFVGKVIQQ